MIYVITGATSFIGVELISYLLQCNEKVIAVCRPQSKGLSKIPSCAKIIYSEMSGYEELHKKIESADIFVNLAWEGTGHDDRDFAKIQKENIDNTLAAIFSAKRMGCKVFVESGSQAEYGICSSIITEETPCKPFSAYGKAKLEVKNRGFSLAEELGIKYVHLRIFSVFGENDHPWTLVMSSLDKMLANNPVELGLCTQNWNFLYVKDAVKQITRLCDHVLESKELEHEVYNIASNDTRPLKDFLETMKRLAHSSSELKYGSIVQKNVVSLFPDITKTARATSFIREYSFEEVISHMIEKRKHNYSPIT